IINIYNFYIVRGIVEGLSSPFPRGIMIFEKLVQRKSQFLPEIALMMNRYLESNLDKINSFEQIEKPLNIYNQAFNLDRYDTRVFNSIQLTLLRILNVKKNMNLDYSPEQKILEELFASYLNEYPKLLDVKFQYIEYLKILGKNDEAKNYLLTFEIESLKNPRYAFMYLISLQNLDKDLAYKYYQKINELKYQPRNQFDYIVLMKTVKDKDILVFEKLKNEYLKKFQDNEAKNLLRSELGLDKLP
ncbi:MAG: hypothetical protein NZ822_02850, partial [Patescibacteria group bacterium]|nr:hypothetical protein [Patescibacteria group bacterium]